MIKQIKKLNDLIVLSLEENGFVLTLLFTFISLFITFGIFLLLVLFFIFTLEIIKEVMKII